MADEKITTDELAEFMQRHIVKTFDVFAEHRDEDLNVNTASWARGRIDAYFQIMEVLDRGRLEMLRADWTRVVTGEGFVDGGSES